MVNAVAFVVSGGEIVIVGYQWLQCLDRQAFTILFSCSVMRRVGLHFDWRDAVLSWVAALKGVVYKAKDGSCTCRRV